jgi:hypothetical protein
MVLHRSIETARVFGKFIIQDGFAATAEVRLATTRMISENPTWTFYDRSDPRLCEPGPR